MGDHEQVFQGICKKEGVSYPVLVPNLKGLEKALSIGVKEIAVTIIYNQGFWCCIRRFY